MNEIKIPDGCKSIKIEQESDNKIVITFEPKKIEWKNGDILFKQQNGLKWIIIYHLLNENEDTRLSYHVMLRTDGGLYFNSICIETDWTMATEQQREELFAALEKEGYRWNAEKLEIEKIEWEPKDGEECWMINYNNKNSLFLVEKTIFCYLFSFNKLIKKTEQEAQEICDKLNAAIN